MSETFQTSILLTRHFTDFDEMAEDVASKWDQRYHRLNGDRDAGFAEQVNLSDAQLTHIGWGPSILIETGTPSDSVGLVLQISGAGRLRLNGTPLGKNTIGVLHAPRAYDLLNPADTEYIVLAVRKERLNRHYAALVGERMDDNAGLSLDGEIAQQQLMQELRSGIKLAHGQPGWLRDAAARDLLVDELLDSVCLAVAPDVEPAKLPRRHLLAGQAGRFIREHIGEPLSLSAVCEQFRVSERSLRQGFLERYGMTPKTFIKRHRLHCLRLLLRAASPDSLTVTQAALSAGLTHLGRTAVEYRAAFGERPTDTLQRQPFADSD